MQLYCNSLTEYKRLATLEVKVGDLLIGNNHPVRIQTMTTTDHYEYTGCCGTGHPLYRSLVRNWCGSLLK